MGLRKIATNVNKRIAIAILILVSIVFNTVVIDRFVLPSKKAPDTILEYAKVYVTRNSKMGSSTSIRGYQFFTVNGFQFSTDKIFITETEITVEHTILLNNLISVSTKNKHYSNELLSGLGGINCYFYLILAFSSTISICILLRKKEISENAFANIILFNLFMIFVLGIIWTSV